MKALLQTREFKSEPICTYGNSTYHGAAEDHMTLIATDSNFNEYKLNYKGKQQFPVDMQNYDIEMEITFTLKRKQDDKVIVLK